MTIGSWVRRPGKPGHLVESVIAGDAITRCGKRLSDAKPLEVHDGPVSRASRPLDWTLCRGGCQRA